jgi:hypothetical protein
MRQIHFLITRQQRVYKRRERAEWRPAGHHQQQQQCLHTLLFQFPELVMSERLVKNDCYTQCALRAGCVCLCARAETAAENKKDELDNLVFSAATSVPWFGALRALQNCRSIHLSLSFCLLLFLLLAQRKLLCATRRTRSLAFVISN